MAKDKKTRLHLSSYAIDPERIERKANEMAKEGWLLEKFGSLFSTYRRGAPNEYEYRVQVKEAGIDRLTYIAELTEFGIEEVGGVGDLLVLRKKADGTPFDLYSDLDSLIAQQKKAVRYLRADDEGYMDISDIVFENYTGELRGSAEDKVNGQLCRCVKIRSARHGSLDTAYNLGGVNNIGSACQLITDYCVKRASRL